MYDYCKPNISHSGHQLSITFTVTTQQHKREKIKVFILKNAPKYIRFQILSCR